MKKTLLLLFVCLFGTLGGVKAWTSVKPYVGRSYYLLNANYERYWYSIKDNGFHITDDLSAANRVTFESANGSNYAFAYYLNDTKYYLHEDDGNAKWPTNSSTMEVGATNYGYYVRNNKDGSKHRYMNAHSDEGVSFGMVEDNSVTNDKYRSWQFISVYEIDSNTPDVCASAAEASNLSEANGWERVTDNVTLNASLSDYFFAIVCANYPGLMVNMANGNASQQAGGGYTSSKSMWYSNSANPEVDNSFLWMIEANTTPNYEGYTFRNASYPSLTIQAEWNTGGWGMSWYAHTNDQANPCQWNSYDLIPSNGVYTIKTLANGGDNYLGLWTPSNDYINGQELAGNRGDGEQGKFLIYRKRIENANLTSYIKNPSFDEAISDANWTLTSDGGEGYWVFNRVAEGGVEEYNRPIIKCEQTITNLPNGIYKVTVQGYYRGGDGGYAGDVRNAKLFANDEEVNLMSINDYKGITEQPSTGNWTKINDTYYVPDNTVAANYAINTLKQYNNEVTVAVSNGTLTIGVKKDETVGNDWTYFDNFTLTYIEGLHDLTPVSGKMKASVEAAQTAAVNAYNSNKTVENYFAATEAIANAEASIAAYANAASYLERVEGVLATTNFYTTAAYNSVYGTYKTDYDAGTLEDATAAGLSYKVATHEGTQRYEANTANDLLIPGWTIGGNDATALNSGFYINTWSTESAGSGDAADFANPFYEYWVSDGSLPATVLSGTLTGLTPNTMYRVTANVRIQGTANSGKIKMQVGTGGEIDVTKGNQIGTTTRYIKDYVAVGKTDADGKLTLKFTVESESGISWLSFRDVMYAEQDDDFTYIIKNADCSSNTGWPGGGRELVEMTAYDGTTRTVFASNNYLDPETVTGQRSQTITIPATGAYKLTTYSKVLGTNNNGYVKIWIGDLGNYVDYIAARHLYTVNTNGDNTSTINSDGSGWVANDIYFTASASDLKTIYINISRGVGAGNNEYAYVSGMKLTYLGTTPEVSFDEAVVNPVVEANLAHADVTIKRNMKSDRWNTFTVPFDMAIPDGWTVKKLTGVDYNESTSNYSLNFEEASSIVAGKAYMVKPGSDITEVNADDVTINTTTVTPSEVSDGDYTANFVGNNSYLTSVPRGSYIISNNVFYAVDTDIIQKGFRAYITVGGPSSARSTVSYDTEGGVTDIQNVVVNGLDKSGAQKDGKYFENNKIVIMKNGVKYSANGQKLN